jgi:hypothetical protein
MHSTILAHNLVPVSRRITTAFMIATAGAGTLVSIKEIRSEIKPAIESAGQDQADSNKTYPS